MRAYIDVRSAWPTFIKGFVCITMQGAPRDITVEQAATWSAINGGCYNWRPSVEEQEVLRFERFVAD